MFFKYCGFIYHIWTCNKREGVCLFVIISITFCMICMMFFILSHILWTLAPLQTSARTRGLNSYQMFPSTLYQSTSELDCDIINEELMSPQKHCLKIHCESFCVKENCPLYLCKQHHQSYKKLLKLLNNVLSGHWFLLSCLLEPWLNYRCDDLKKEQVQKHLLIHTDHWLPLLFNFSHTLKCSFRLGLHHGINNTWTQIICH